MKQTRQQLTRKDIHLIWHKDILFVLSQPGNEVTIHTDAVSKWLQLVAEVAQRKKNLYKPRE
jgi:hypothetical protein